MTYAVWNRAEAWVAMERGVDDALHRFRRFHAECEAAGLSADAMDAAVECRRLRTKVDAGDGGAVLDAVAYCAAHDLVMPEWLAEAFLSRHRAVGEGWARDWNDERAFGRAYPKGTNIAGIRAKVNDAPAAYHIAAELLAADPSRPFDHGFYEAIGARVGVGKTRAAELIQWFIGDNGSPPLEWLRSRLETNGRDIDAALDQWRAERFDAWCRERQSGK